MNDLFAQQFAQTAGHGAMALCIVVTVILGLAQCFLGYVLFRALLAVLGAIGGYALGAVAAVQLRGEPTAADFVVLGCAGAILLAMLAWFLYRVIFALGALAETVFVIVAQFGQSGGAWAAAILLGLLVGVLAFVYLRQVIIILMGLSGGFGAIFALGWAIWPATMAVPADAPAKVSHDWLVAALAGASVLLAAAGMYVQVKLSRLVRSSFAPPRHRRTGDDTSLRPRFTHV
ncbi:MAG: hypothetical protein ACE15C_16180 [Phycisphaerae bacterium]